MSGRRRRIAVVSSTRADYGLLKGVLEEIDSDPALELQLIVTGAHFAARFGLTAVAIAEDGFTPAATVEMLLASDTAVGVTKSLGLGTIGFADAYDRLKPDIVLLLGDRFEVLAAAQAAMFARIPIAHVHGGELTAGAIDDSIRHAVTKMAALHFVSHDEHARRVRQMGEDPSRVFVTGAPGLDAITQLKPMGRRELEQSLDGFRLGRINLLVTFHPETQTEANPAAQMDELLAGIDSVQDAHVVVTGVNADPGNLAIAERTRHWVQQRRDRAVEIPSLGPRRYLSALSLFDAVVGNSSSGIIEAPSFRIPTVNVGERQRARLRARSVIDCVCERKSIAAALRRVLDPAFRNGLAELENPFGDGHASPRIVAALKAADLSALRAKTFTDLPGC